MRDFLQLNLTVHCQRPHFFYRLTNPQKLEEILHNYIRLQIFSLLIETHMAETTFVLMGIGLILVSGLSFSTIRFFDSDMNMVFYLLQPFCAVIVFVIILALLPIGIHENSKTVLIKWRLEENFGSHKFIKRKLKGMRPVNFYSGWNSYQFYSIDKGVMGTYMMAIMDTTTNLFMTFRVV